MAIQSRDEFDVVLGNILLTLERLAAERPNHAPLAQARRDLKQVAETVRAKAATKQTLEKLSKATEVVSAVAHDVEMDDKMLDLSDYLTNSL